MNPEDLMALIEAMGAQGPAAEGDPRRRRSRGLGGYEGIGGAAVGIQEMLPWLHGLGGYDYSGPGRGEMGGLVDLLGPAASHFERQNQGQGFGPPGATQLPGFQGQGPEGQGPPGLDNRNPIGGPNIAPGNIDTGQAIVQPQRAFGQMPRTQGWRNVAPGYSAAAGLGYGTPEFENRLRGIGAGPVGGQGFGSERGIAGGPGNVAPGQAGGAGTAGGGGAQGARPGQGGAPAPTGGGARPTPGGARPAPAGRPTARQIGAKKGGGAGGFLGSPDAGGKKGGPTQKQVGAKKGGGNVSSGKGGPGSPDAGGKKGGPTEKQVGAKKGGGNVSSGTSPQPSPDAGGSKGGPSEKQVNAKKGGSTGKVKPKPKGYGGVNTGQI